MEVAKNEEEKQEPPMMMKDYWKRYYKSAVILTSLLQVLIVGVFIGLSLTVLDVNINISFWLVMFFVFVLLETSSILLLNKLSFPLESLTRALTHTSGELTDTTPPNPNDHDFEQNGLKLLLQHIYEMGSLTEPTKESEEPHTSVALNNTSAGFVILNTRKDIIYANKNAPVQIDPSGKQSLKLIFEDNPSLDEWLMDCEKHSVHAEQTWKRVPNKITGEEGRKIYDISATYQKGSKAEVVLVLFERTAEYQPEDEDLDFIAFAAHELRGPITVIRGYLDVLGDELENKIDDEQKELLKRLVVSSNRLSSYVNNILNASKYDRRHLKVRLQEDTIAGIYDTINEDMQLRASSQNRILSVNIPNNLPTVAADRASISEVLSNLIDNAIKYSNEGGVVTVTATADSSSVKVFVEDRGIGMPGSVVSNLFHKFYRSHRSRETVAGTGIGLYICKAMIESHGGKIGVRSVEDSGSVFEFSLPIYSTIADKLTANNSSNEKLIERNENGWIKNHAMYRG